MQEEELCARFCAGLPKAELHVHIEGTLSPGQRLALARRNGLALPDMSIEEIEAARDFGGRGTPTDDLKEMLDYYYAGVRVLRTQDDFFDLAVAYLRQSHEDNVRYAEISFDPQAHTSRGVSFDAVVEGLIAGLAAGSDVFGVRSQLIMCINRDRDLESALATLEMARPHRGHIAGVGLDSLEEGNPPVKFQAFYERARAEGYRLTAHCDVDQRNAVEHIWQCIEQLRVDRIDHGLNCLEDRRLVDALVERGICLTACPTWRPRDPQPRRLPQIRAMLDRGLRVTLNSDDPGVFSSGSLGQLLPAVAKAGSFTWAELARMAIHAFEGAWLPAASRKAYVAEVIDYLERFKREECAA